MQPDLPGGGPSVSRPFLLFTAALAGALVMVIEILGSRVIGPFFGISLFIWTSLITVTLMALAAGYAIGGLLADRRGARPSWAWGIILLAGLLVLLIPLSRGPALKACLPLGLRLGAFASSALLFGPALFLLGCVSPWLVRIAAREMDSVGRTVGLLSAVSAAGSFVGTVLTGFVLINRFGVDRILWGTGVALLLLTAFYFVRYERRPAVCAFMIIPVLLWPRSGMVEKTLPNGVEAREVHRRDTYYGSLRVVDYRSPSERTRELLIDGQIQGGIDLTDGQSVYPYSYFMEFVPFALNPHGTDGLVIGLGAGVIPTWYGRRGVTTDVVDINPDVLKIATSYFGFRPTGAVHIVDARWFLNTTQRSYDYVVLDVFSGDTTPSHILSLESLRLVAARMKPGAVLGINMVGSFGAESLATVSIVRTLEKVFDTVDICPGFDADEPESFGNVSVFAYQGPRRQPDANIIASFSVHDLAAFTVNRFIAARHTVPANAPYLTVTDDYNPVDIIDVRLKERYRRSMLSGTDWDILL